MDNFQRLQRRAYIHILMSNTMTLMVGVLVWILLVDNGLSSTVAFGIAALVMLATMTLTSFMLSKLIMQPLHILWQAILHISPDTVNIPPPNLKSINFGKDLVISLTNRIYQFASQDSSKDLDKHRNSVLQAVNVVSLFPQPLFVFNKKQMITNASNSAISYLGIDSHELFGKKLYHVVDLEFPTEHTLEKWITDCQKNKVTDQASWQRVRVNLKDGKTIRQCDVHAYYNRDNQSGTEFIVTITDRSEVYSQDDQSLSFIALAVHELRTPLTMMRGYIEVFEEELGRNLSPELNDYLRKLKLSSEQLTAFVNTVMNVIKVDENHLSFKLSEGNWKNIMIQSTMGINSRAQVLGKNISYHFDDDLPSVAVDPVSITEVITNLLDNAIKYSGEEGEIKVTCKVNKEGMVETSVQDYGVGIPENVIPNLFEKFYRNHRTRSQFGGTGLGLYLSKAIVTAHGGMISVKSKPGQGSTFTFTLLPYSQLDQSQKDGKSDGITRHAHGWIKNHSMYRR